MPVSRVHRVRAAALSLASICTAAVAFLPPTISRQPTEWSAIRATSTSPRIAPSVQASANIAVIAAAAGDIGAYEAPTFQVNSIADTDDGACTLPGAGNGCTLREAINAANTAVGAELITFAPALTTAGPTTIT